MSRKASVVLVLALAATLALGVQVEAALAAPEDVGKNVGKVASSWAAGLLCAAVVFAGFGPLAKRQLGEIGVVALGGVVLGGFVFATPVVVSIIRSTWKLVGG